MANLAPLVPSRASRPVRTSVSQTNISVEPAAGALFAPGQWPTPELSLSPVSRYMILDALSAFTSDAIQFALDSLGTSSTLYLPQCTVWTINDPIQLHEHQELATWGYPTDEKMMSRLEAEKQCHPHIINALAKVGARLRNVVIDGSRERYGHDSDCGVMLHFGQAMNQVVDRCVIRNPRHWSCVQVVEGSQNVRITNNFIGPAGIGADKENGKWADGISFAGANGLVAGNRIKDVTDGAIVVSGAPGTLITSNTIVAGGRLCLGGINLVDWAPHDGDYTQTRVTHNTIMTQGPDGYIKLGIGQGPSAWWTSNSSEQKFNRGAVVTKNLIDAQDIGYGHGAIGYGFAVAADVRDWICIGNKSSAKVLYQGNIVKSLPTPNVAPGPFVHDVPHARLKFFNSTLVSSNVQHGDEVILQPEFSYGRGRIKSLISVTPGSSRVLTYQPGQFRLARGSFINLKGTRLGYEDDGAVRIRKRLDNGDGTTLWECGLDQQTSSSAKYLTYTTGGKLCIFDATNNQVCFDLTPHLPLHAASAGDDNAAPSLVISDTNPLLSVITQTASRLFSTSYTFPLNQAFPVGRVIARSYSYGNASRTLLYTLSPYCQFVVLQSKKVNAIIPELPLVWPAVARERQWDWEIAWTTPNPRTPVEKWTDAVMYFQGDGNLVIRLQNIVLWASGTNDRTPPAQYLRLGIGSVTEPWVEIVNPDGERIWSSNMDVQIF